MPTEGSAADDVAAKLGIGLKRLAKAVVVITTRHKGARLAMAATAVSELTREPPALLVSANRTASLYQPQSQGADFCINVLRADQAEIARLTMTAKGEDRFAIGDWQDDGQGTPYLRDAQASFFCRADAQMEYGTHAILIGQVSEVLIEGAVDPLIYADGGFTRIETDPVGVGQ